MQPTSRPGDTALDRSVGGDRFRHALQAVAPAAGAAGFAAAAALAYLPAGTGGGRWSGVAAALGHEPRFWWAFLLALAARRLLPDALGWLEPALAGAAVEARAAALRPLTLAWVGAGVLSVAGWPLWPRPDRAAATWLLGATLLGLLAVGWRLRALARPPLAVADRGRLLAAAALLLCLAAVPSWPAPQGDEPHYLLVAESLRHDGDLDLVREYRDRVYRNFHPGPLSPHYKPGVRPGSRYSMHGVGYPLLLLPAYAAGEAVAEGGGVVAARLAQALLYALFVLSLYRLLALLAGRRAALFGTLATAFLSPLAWAPLQLFPETPAMAAATGAALLAWRGGRRREWSAGVLLAALPWLGVKYIPAAFVLAVGLPWARGQDTSSASRARFLAPLLGACVGHAAFTWTLYGSLSPAAVYLGADPNFGRQPGYGDSWSAYLADWPGALRTLAGYFLDAKEGLLAVAPQWLLVALGWPWLRRRHPRLALLTLALLAVHLGPYALSQQAGGQGPPARPVMATLWLLAVPLAAGVALPARGLGAVAKGALLVAGVAVTAALAADPSRLPHDYGVAAPWLWRALAPAGSSWWRVWPVYLGARGVVWGAAQWVALVVAVAAAAALGRSAVRGRGPQPRGPSLAAWGGAAYASVGVVVLGLLSSSALVSDRHVGGPVGAGVQVLVEEAIPARAWVEREGVWVAPGRATDLVVVAERPLAGARLWLRTLVRTPVRLVIEGQARSVRIEPDRPLSLPWPATPARRLPDGRVAYRVRVWARQGAAPADVEGGEDRRPLGVYLRWETAEGGAS